MVGTITGGDYAKNEDAHSGRSRLPFDQNGYMLTGWVYWDGAWHYHNAAGAQVSGWMNQGGTWYYLAPDTGSHGDGLDDD